MLTGGRIKQNSRRIWEVFLDQVFPRTCVCCGRLAHGRGEIFTCGLCRKGYHRITGAVCSRCGAPVTGAVENPVSCGKCRDLTAGFYRARSLFRYSGTGARLIHSLKYENGVWLQREITSLLLEFPAWAHFFKDSTLIPVPLHPRRIRKRGYNQAETVAMAITAAFPETRILSCLKRDRITLSQTLLSREMRFRNMHKAFSCAVPVPKGPLILVDDVLTTGATLNSAAGALIAGGGQNISAFTLAHG